MDLNMVRTVLSKAEQEVFFLALTSLTNTEIAKELDITKHGVKAHLRRIYKKTKTKSRIELLAKFVETGKSDQKLLLYVFQMQKDISALKEQLKNLLPAGSLQSARA
jgi:DNA-binding CsgD family transcriptional regulator